MGRASQDPWSLSYQMACNAAAQDAGLAREGDGPSPVKGIFSELEMKWMAQAFRTKLTAKEFVALVERARANGNHLKSATFRTRRPNG